jgi:hypothetical protein
MNWLLIITGTASINPKNEGIGVFGLFACIMIKIRTTIVVKLDIKIAINTERGYIPPALHLNEQY